MTTLDLSFTDSGPAVIEGLRPMEHCLRQLLVDDTADVAQESGVLTIAATLVAPADILAVAGVAAARVVAVRVLSGAPMTLICGSSAGLDQAIVLSDLFVWMASVARLDTLQVAGTGQIEFFVAGEQ